MVLSAVLMVDTYCISMRTLQRHCSDVTAYSVLHVQQPLHMRNSLTDTLLRRQCCSCHATTACIALKALLACVRHSHEHVTPAPAER
jgi:hypothetical protein